MWVDIEGALVSRVLRGAVQGSIGGPEVVGHGEVFLLTEMEVQKV